MIERIVKLRQNLIKQKLKAILVTNFYNIRYLSGFVGLMPTEREAYFLLTEDTVFLLTDGRYIDAAVKLKIKKEKFKIIEIGQKDDVVKLIKTLIVKFKIKRLGFEKNDLKFGEYQKLEKKLTGVKLVPTKNLVEDLRAVKDQKELECIRKAARIADKCFTHLLGFIKPGLTEKEVADEIEWFIRRNGAADLAFNPIVASGSNSSMPHHVASRSYKLKANSLVLIDFGAKFDGYCADMTRTIFLGEATAEQKKIYNTVLEAQKMAVEKLRNCITKDTSEVEELPRIAGQGTPRRWKRLKKFAIEKFNHRNTSEVARSVSEGTPRMVMEKDVDKVARSYIKKSGLPDIPHGLGHGVGLSEHEKPTLSPKSKNLLKPGMVFTIEPAVYIPGKFGIRLEDLVLLERKRIKILTKSPRKIIQL